MDRNKLAVIADPDPNYRRWIASLLQPDFTSIPTSTLQETWREIWQTVQNAFSRRQPPPLLLLELEQPDGDGVEFIRYLQRDPYLRHVLITCVTHRSSLRDKLAAFRAGADDYVVKPCLPDQLVGMMLLLQRSGYLARSARAGGVSSWQSHAVRRG